MTNEFLLLRDFIEKNCGIYLDESKTYLIETRLTTLMAENGCKTYSDFYYKAKNDTSNTLRDKIIDAMTTNETLWFRDASPFVLLQKHLFPIYSKEIISGKRQKIRIWSSACSTGQEPYSIAIAILDYCKTQTSVKPEHFEIIASDISQSVLFLAKLGRYDQHVISRGLAEDIRNRYFKFDGKVWVLDESIKQMVNFRKLNLQEDFNFIGKTDILFCRNVLIYFSENFKKDLLKRFNQLLQPSGHLIVGSSESITNYSIDYKMLTYDKTLYYQVK
jgi:chemotaxis protein methyltransferase CheR